ncbi:MAG TPA: glycine cleavage system aminomethyltransferase GcvT [Candidatus Hydrogenedentes bacterium]|nr:glycine cleavage system aminomethyltransferase GcvT [Candidatus Hydrogenedentota bacterium]
MTMRQTPLFNAYARHGARVVDFHGWALPVQFRGIVEEHLHTRRAAGVFDCSHMGEFMVRGAEAIAALDRLVIGDMPSLKPGRCRYTALLNADAGIIDDCVALRLSQEEMYFVTNAGPLEEVSALLAARVPGVEDLSAATAKIDVQGPRSREILLSLGLQAAAPLAYWSGVRTEWRGVPLVVTRAGYTGELGYELYVPADAGEAVWDAVLAAEGTMPCGLGARDTLRSEMAYPLNGDDLDPSRTPLETAMDRFIAWETEFPGKARLLHQRDAGDYERLTPVKSLDRRAPRAGFEVFDGADRAGTVTSGTFGPSLGCGVGLAYLSPAAAVPGKRLTAGPRALEIEVCEAPVYREGTCRVKITG